MITSRHFTEKEFNKCNPSCSLQDMNQGTIDKMDIVRGVAGMPISINSAYRSPEHDRSKGRSGTGAHAEGKGIDFKCTNSSDRFKIVEACLAAGFTRIGISSTFIHADDSNTHVQRVIWTY